MTQTRYVACVWGLLIAASLSASQPQGPATPVERFDEVVRAATKDATVGLAVAVTYGGSVVYAKAFGPGNAETQQPMTLDSLWTPSAISAYYSAAVTASLASEGVLSLDEPVGKYWPALHPSIGRITLRQFFQQRGGVIDLHINAPLLDAGALKAWALSCNDSCIIAEPGYVESFSSRSGNLAAAVVEEAAKKPFADLLDARVFAPLQFKRTSLSILKVATHPIAFGHRAADGRLAVVRPLAMNWVGWPTTSIFTPVNEAIVFAGALVNGGKWQGRDIFSAAIVRETLSLLPAPDGAGAFVSSTGWAGVRASTALAPDQHFAVIAFSNTPTATALPGTLVTAARRIWLGDDAVPPPPADDKTPSRPVSESVAAQLTGVYRNEYVISLMWRDGALHFRDDGTSYRQPGPWIEIRHVAGEHYRLVQPHAPSGTAVIVVRGPTGAVTHIVHGSRAFRKD